MLQVGRENHFSGPTSGANALHLPESCEPAKGESNATVLSLCSTGERMALAARLSVMEKKREGVGQAERNHSEERHVVNL